MFRKFVCVFLIVWLSAAPAYAATSSSALDWQVAPMSLDDGITLSTRAGYYDLASDSYTWGSYSTVSNPFSTFAAWPVSPVFNASNRIYAAGEYRLTGSGLPSAGSSWRIIVGDYRLALYAGEQFIEMSDTAVPFSSSVEVTYSGTVKRNNSFTTASDTVVYPFTSIFNGEGLMHPWNKSGDVTVSFPFPTDPYIDDGYEYEWVSAHVTSIVFRTTYATTVSNYDILSFFDWGDEIYVQFGWDDTRLYILEEESTVSNETNIINSGLSAVNSSINNMTSSMSNQFNQIKLQLTQSTDTITSKIDTLSSDIKTGLSEVKDSILDLPHKMQDMLTDFIVPDEDAVADKMTDFQGLAEDKLGVIYQVPTMLFDMAEGIVSGVSNPEGEMVLPKFEIIMPATNQTRSVETLTVWEEYRFPIWPAGTEVIQTAVQTATSMICVIFTFNALKRKYEEWLDGH